MALTIENTTTTKYWNGSAFVSGVTTVTPTGTTGWSYSLAVSALTNANAYSVTAKATDSAGNTNTDINTFTYSTTAPSVAVSYPVSGTTYGTNWSGTLTGSSSAANGATVSSVALTVEDTTNSTYWNGTTFQGTSTTVTPTGTTSWSDALAASALVSGNSYSVSATATDSATNTGTSATVTFTYNTSPPSVAVTYPVNSTTYGANWSGTLTGTSASNAGGGTSISSVALTIENTTNSTYWNGTSFVSGCDHGHPDGHHLVELHIRGIPPDQRQLLLGDGQGHRLGGQHQHGHQRLHLQHHGAIGDRHLPGGIDQLRSDGTEEQRRRSLYQWRHLRPDRRHDDEWRH